MDILILVGLFCLGLGVLTLGASWLVTSAVNVAEHLRVSPLVVSLTLVGFGTSLPELVSSVQAALSGATGLAYGNIIGSNLANILLILGACALVTELTLSQKSLRRDGGMMLLATVFFVVVAYALTPNIWVGVSGLILLAAYALSTVRTGQVAMIETVDPTYETRSDTDTTSTAPPRSTFGLGRASVMFLLGLIALVVGGRWLVSASISLAQALNISDAVIGVTIVALGTSMPELVTSLIAALKKQNDVAIGNILGSNIYNILGIGGVTAMISSAPVPDALMRFDICVLLAATLILLGFAFTGLRIRRWEAACLMLGYCAYITALILRL